MITGFWETSVKELELMEKVEWYQLEVVGSVLTLFGVLEIDASASTSPAEGLQWLRGQWQCDLEGGFGKRGLPNLNLRQGLTWAKKVSWKFGTWLTHSETGLQMMVRKDLSICWRWVMEVDAYSLAAYQDLFQWWRICQCCPGHWLQELVCSLSLREPSYQRPRLFTGFSDTLGIGSLPVCWWWSNNSPLTCLVLFSYEPARCFPGAYFAKITWKLRKICTY